MSRKAAAIAAAAVSVGAASVLTPRLAPHRDRSEAPKTSYVYVIDWSLSSSSIRRRLIGVALAEIDALPQGTPVTVYRMGSDTAEIYDGRVDEKTSDDIAAELAKDALRSDPKSRTNFSKMARALAENFSSFKGTRIFARVLTDGGDDFAGDSMAAQEYRRSARVVSGEPRLADLAFYGVRPGFREALRRAFHSAGRRLRIIDGDQQLGQ